MKKVLLIFLAVMMLAGAASADHLGIYSDQAASGCTLVAPGGFVPFSIYVVHRFTAGATGSQFAVQDLSGQAATGFAALGGFLVIGNLADLSLAYGSCLAPVSGDIPAVSLNYFAVGNPTPCGLVEVIPAPTAGGIVKVTDCNFAEVPASGGKFWFNANETCGNCEEPVATEETTWGKVKSLYR